MKTAVVSSPRTGMTELDDSRLKLTPQSFRALYDYSPATMSPNKESANEELTFHAGDIINVYGDKDHDGFFLGQVSVVGVRVNRCLETYWSVPIFFPPQFFLGYLLHFAFWFEIFGDLGSGFWGLRVIELGLRVVLTELN